MLKQKLTLQILNFPKEKNKKDELGEQIMKEFFGLRANAYSYLKDSNMEIKKQKAQKCVS